MYNNKDPELKNTAKFHALKIKLINSDCKDSNSRSMILHLIKCTSNLSA